MAINLEIPKKLQAVIDKASPRRRGDAPADLAQVRPEGTRLPRRTGHAGQPLRGNLGGQDHLASPAPRRSATRSARTKTTTAATCPRCSMRLEISWGDVALLLSVPRQGLGNAAISGVATDEQLARLGKVWAAMAITEPSFGSDSAAVSTTADARRRRVRDQRREDLRHRRFAGQPHRGVGDAGQVAGPRRDQVVHRAARTSRRHRRAARAQARHQGLRHRGDPLRQCPHPEGQPAGRPGDPRGEGFCRGHGDLRQHPADRRGDGRRGRAAPRWRSCARSSPTPAWRSPTTNPRTHRAPRRRSSCGWRPTGRPATC